MYARKSKLASWLDLPTSDTQSSKASSSSPSPQAFWSRTGTAKRFADSIVGLEAYTSSGTLTTPRGLSAEGWTVSNDGVTPPWSAASLPQWQVQAHERLALLERMARLESLDKEFQQRRASEHVLRLEDIQQEWQQQERVNLALRENAALHHHERQKSEQERLEQIQEEWMIQEKHVAQLDLAPDLKSAVSSFLWGCKRLEALTVVAHSSVSS